MKIEKWGRFWAVYDADGVLVCVCVYKKGAMEVVRRLSRQDERRPQCAVVEGASTLLHTGEVIYNGDHVSV